MKSAATWTDLHDDHAPCGTDATRRDLDGRSGELGAVEADHGRRFTVPRGRIPGAGTDRRLTHFRPG
jgi:hypothetical protein